MRWASSALIGLALSANICVPAIAADRPPITERNFTLDLYQGPIITNSRILGLAGAFTAVAEGTAGMGFNPASVAHRAYYSADWWDYDYDLDLLVPGIFNPSGVDFWNVGERTSSAFVAFAIGGHLQFNEFGVGLFINGQTVGVAAADAGQSQSSFRAIISRLVLGYGFWDHQIIVGASLKTGVIDIKHTDDEEPLYESPSIGGNFGILYLPRHLPFRIGVTLDTPMAVLDPGECTDPACEDLILPTGVSSPWSLNLGAAWYFAFDGQKYNPRPLYHDAEAVLKKRESGDLGDAYIGGRYIAVSADLVFTGADRDAVALPAFFAQERLFVSSAVSISPRLGVESEVFNRRLRLRAGTYWEPGRYEGTSGRIHGTGSLQLRMFDLRVPLLNWYGLCVATALDLAARYSNMSFSIITFWH